MNCKKYTLVNTGTSITTFSYMHCNENVYWDYQVELKPNQIKNIWAVEKTYITAFETGITILNLELFPPTPNPTPSNTPTPSVTPSITPTNTSTPVVTPTTTTTSTNTPTPTQTPTVTTSITPSATVTQTTTSTQTPTPSITPTYTPTNTQTPTITPTVTQTEPLVTFSLGYNVSSASAACLNAKSSPTTYYTYPGTPAIGFGTQLYTDTELTILVPAGYYHNGLTTYYTFNSNNCTGSGGQSC